MSDSDRLSAEKIVAVQPVWTGIVQTKDVVDLPPSTLLHAGPPFVDPEAITQPILHAAIHAARFEGWAATAEEAKTMIRKGTIQLQPAQDWNTVVPLAFVLSPGMSLQAVEDADGNGQPAYAPINAGMVLPLAHGGSDDPAVIDRHHWVNNVLAPQLVELLAEPIDLLPIIAASLSNGDECHGRTGAGTAAIRQIAATRLPGNTALLDFLDASPGFFLFLVMAGIKCMLQAGEGMAGSAIVTSVGGNGRQFGIKLANKPDKWFMADCDPPQGPFFDGGDVSNKNPLGGIGDSMVIDALGLGGMALAQAPELAATLSNVTPKSDPEGVLELAHPGLLDGHKRIGLNARRVVELGEPLRAVLGILDADGRAGIIGRGLFKAPMGPFSQALTSN